MPTGAIVKKKEGTANAAFFSSETVAEQLGKDSDLRKWLMQQAKKTNVIYFS